MTWQVGVVLCLSEGLISSMKAGLEGVFSEQVGYSEETQEGSFDWEEMD